MNTQVVEAQEILAYGARQLNFSVSPDEHMVTRFMTACAAHELPDTVFTPWVLDHPWCMGPLDAGSALRGRDGAVHKKFLIAAALLECSPHSAESLLPRHGHWSWVLARSLVHGVYVCAMTLLGIFVWQMKKKFIHEYADRAV